MRWMRWEYIGKRWQKRIHAKVKNSSSGQGAVFDIRSVVSTEVFSLWDHRTVFTLGSGDFAKSQPYNELLPSECAIHPQVDAAKRSRSGRLWDCKESHIVNESLVARRALASLVLTHAELRASPCAVKDRCFFWATAMQRHSSLLAYWCSLGLMHMPWHATICLTSVVATCISSLQGSVIHKIRIWNHSEVINELCRKLRCLTIQRRIASLLRLVFFTLSVRAKKVNMSFAVVVFQGQGSFPFSKQTGILLQMM